MGNIILREIAISIEFLSEKIVTVQSITLMMKTYLSKSMGIK